MRIFWKKNFWSWSTSKFYFLNSKSLNFSSMTKIWPSTETAEISEKKQKWQKYEISSPKNISKTIMGPFRVKSFQTIFKPWKSYFLAFFYLKTNLKLVWKLFTRNGSIIVLDRFFGDEISCFCHFWFFSEISAFSVKGQILVIGPKFSDF